VKPVLLLAAIALPLAIGQENKPEPLHRIVDGVRITASSIQQDASPSENPRLPVIYLKGNVEIVKPSCTAVSSEKPCYTKMVQRADEAEYHPDSGEIQAFGNVRVTFEELK
jgi:lipopolysaccharide assembly outer membrane protein LptD (OstA)